MDAERVNETKKEFSRNLRAARGKLFDRQMDFAKQIGLEPNSYTMYENGLREPKLYYLKKMAKELKTDPNELLGVSRRDEEIRTCVEELIEEAKDNEANYIISKNKDEEGYDYKSQYDIGDYYGIWQEAEEQRIAYLKKRIREKWIEEEKEQRFKQMEEVQHAVLGPMAEAIGVNLEAFENKAEYCVKMVNSVCDGIIRTPLELLLFIYFTGESTFEEDWAEKKYSDDYVGIYPEGSAADFFMCRRFYVGEKYLDDEEMRINERKYMEEYCGLGLYKRRMAFERSKENRIPWVEHIAASLLKKSYEELAAVEQRNPSETAFRVLKEAFLSRKDNDFILEFTMMEREDLEFLEDEDEALDMIINQEKYVEEAKELEKAEKEFKERERRENSKNEDRGI